MGVTISYLNHSPSGAFSVNESAKEAVVSYIADQKIRHRKSPGETSYAIDERYVWTNPANLAPFQGEALVVKVPRVETLG